MLYLIEDKMQETTAEALFALKHQFVAVITRAEWETLHDRFDMGIEWEPDMQDIHNTKAEVNYDSLTGTFLVPERLHLTAPGAPFAFALDEKGVVFIDESGFVEKCISEIRRTKKWAMPSLERFLYDFLEQIVREDPALIERYELELDAMEDRLLSSGEEIDMGRLNIIRGEMRELSIHYDQLLNLGQELEENENGFFQETRYFHLFLNRMERLHDAAGSLREHTMQLRDLYHAQLERRQNHIMTVLTVVTTIFMPLTLIAGWYGMNFENMPELKSPYGYPIVIVVSILIVLVSFILLRFIRWK